MVFGFGMVENLTRPNHLIYKRGFKKIIYFIINGLG
jgi:hypothetical protein